MTELPNEPSARTLAAYLSGECTSAELAEVLRWAHSSPESAAQLAKLRRAWHESAEAEIGGVGSWDADQMWKAVSARLNDDQPPLHLVGSAPVRRVVVKRRRDYTGWIAAAACAALIVVAKVGGRVANERLTKPEHVPAPPREYRTDRGQRASVTLPDGSAFQLGPLSVLRVPADYGSPERVVDLEGDGYFNVTHDSLHPFSVRTARTTIRDVGTRFVVRARSTEQRVEVAVADGEVSVEPTAVSDPNGTSPSRVAPRALTVVAGQVALVDERGLARLLPRASVASRFAWTRGELVFDSVAVPRILSEMSRWYGYTFVLNDKSLDTVRLTTVLRGETVTEAILVLGTALDVGTHIHGDTVTLGHRKDGGTPP